VTCLRTALAAATALLLCAVPVLPADAATSAQSARARAAGPLASAASRTGKGAHARGTRTKRCGSHASSRARPKCRANARRTTGHARRLQRLRSVSNADTTTSSSRAEALQAASIAQVLATPCQNTNLTPTTANLPLVRAAVLCLINTERAQHGEEPLHSDRRLEAAAEGHGREMLAVNYFDHISPSGVTPVDRVREAGYFPSSEVGYIVGENLAWGTLSLSTPETIVKAWIASPEHLANILEAKYRDTGIDVEPAVPQALADGVEGGLYTQEFGVIVN
jgi:uncharacterized protein YkwD